MRAELVACAVLLAACGDIAVQNVGAERRLTVTTATPLAAGGWREAGFRLSETDTDEAARLWYGTSRADGSLPTIVTLPEERGASAIRTGAVLGDGWVVAGYLTNSSGQRVAWVRALDDANGERWTTTLPSPEGRATEVTAIAVANEGSLVVAGLEQVSDAEQDGWVALLDQAGMPRWRHGFHAGFQMQARGFVPSVVVTQDGPPSALHRQLWLAGKRTTTGGGYALQFTLDGELWDSEPFGTTGSISRGVVAAGNMGVVICTSLDGAVQLGWTQGGGVSGAAVTEVRPGAPFTLRGCLGSSTQVALFGETSRDGAPVPTVLTVSRSTRAVVGEPQEWSASRGALVFGAVEGSGGLRLLGRTQQPLRRWSASAP